MLSNLWCVDMEESTNIFHRKGPEAMCLNGDATAPWKRFWKLGQAFINIMVRALLAFTRQEAGFSMSYDEQGRLILPPTELLYIITLISTRSLLSSFLLPMHTQHYLSHLNMHRLLEWQLETQSRACHICIQIFYPEDSQFWKKKAYLSWYLGKQCNITTVCIYGRRIYSEPMCQISFQRKFLTSYISFIMKLRRCLNIYIPVHISECLLCKSRTLVIWLLRTLIEGKNSLYGKGRK